jgi:hypothetical protein
LEDEYPYIRTAERLVFPHGKDTSSRRDADDLSMKSFDELLLEDIRVSFMIHFFEEMLHDNEDMVETCSIDMGDSTKR